MHSTSFTFMYGNTIYYIKTMHSKSQQRYIEQRCQNARQLHKTYLTQNSGFYKHIYAIKCITLQLFDFILDVRHDKMIAQ